jgi:hypothetical protein
MTLPLAVGAVMIWGWGAGQYPYLSARRPRRVTPFGAARLRIT